MLIVFLLLFFNCLKITNLNYFFVILTLFTFKHNS